MQVHELILHVALTSPRISALGFFYVGRKLIPTVSANLLLSVYCMKALPELKQIVATHR